MAGFLLAEGLLDDEDLLFYFALEICLAVLQAPFGL